MAAGRAGFGSLPDYLRVGIVLARPAAWRPNPLQRPRATPEKLLTFCDALGLAFGTEVTPDAFLDYDSLEAALREGKIDVAWLPPILASRGTLQGWAVPVVVAVRHGSSRFGTALFTREGSPIQSLRDLVGVRAAWVDHQSAAGFLVIRAWLRAQGLDLRQAFAQQRFCGEHAAVVDVVLRGEADVGATYVNLNEAGEQSSAGWGDAPVRVLASAGPISGDFIAAGSHLTPAIVQRLRTVLLDHATSSCQAAAALLGAEGFHIASPTQLSPLVELIQHLDQEDLVPE